MKGGVDMTLFIIILIICIFAIIISYANKKTDTLNYRTSNQGSRYIESDEWGFWSKRLLDEYNELTGYNLSMPKIDLSENNISTAYYYAFGGSAKQSPTREQYYRAVAAMKEGNSLSPRQEDFIFRGCFCDNKAIETLRERHKLPSNEELTIRDSGISYTGNISIKQYYKSLYDVIEQCVKRSVYNSGYKYGGTDWIGQDIARMRGEDVENKYPYLNNDPTFKGKK